MYITASDSDLCWPPGMLCSSHCAGNSSAMRTPSRSSSSYFLLWRMLVPIHSRLSFYCPPLFLLVGGVLTVWRWGKGRSRKCGSWRWRHLPGSCGLCSFYLRNILVSLSCGACVRVCAHRSIHVQWPTYSHTHTTHYKHRTHTRARISIRCNYRNRFSFYNHVDVKPYRY